MPVFFPSIQNGLKRNPRTAGILGDVSVDNVFAILCRTAESRPGHIAIVETDGETRREYSYATVCETANAIANNLRSRGVRRGQRVALTGANRFDYVACFFGIAAAGGTVVPIPMVAGSREIVTRVTKPCCVAVIADEESRPAIRSALATPPLLTINELITDPASPVAATPAEDAMILFTSGTLEDAKGALITHRSLLAHTAALVSGPVQLSEHDHVLGVLPLTHSYGLRMTILCSFSAAARVILMPRFKTRSVARALCEEGVTWFPGVPTMFAALANEESIRRVSTLRWCLSAGAPLADDTRRRAADRLGADIRQGYGLTEATFSTIDAPPEPVAVGTVGRPVNGVELRIVDAEGNELPPGQVGEVVVRGHNVMRGYLDDADATEAVFRNGWLRTGDVGQLDAEGRLTLVDRAKDLIIRGGYNVYPSEIENVIAEHPDVALACVVGLPDEYYGEEIVAAIVLSPGASLDRVALLEFARARLSKHQVPSEFVAIEGLPTGPSGKVLRREVRRLLRQS